MPLSRQDLPESALLAFCWCCFLSLSYCPVHWVIGKSVANSTKQGYFVCNGNFTTVGSLWLTQYYYTERDFLPRLTLID